MSAEVPLEQLPLDLPEEALLANMLAYHAVQFAQREKANPYAATITYEDVALRGVRTYAFSPLAKGQELDAQGRATVLHYGNKSGRVEVFRMYNAGIIKHAPTSSADVPIGVFIVPADTMLEMGRPDLGRTQRRRLQETSYAAYRNSGVVRQDVYKSDGVEHRHASIAPNDELGRLHNAFAGTSTCFCQAFVRYDHYGSPATLPPEKLAKMVRHKA